ncbi:hypothetical protein Nepgr_013649 [Nepenthes gracilis]|uniref:Uncharacterized protein n=1 Tax=Nepenthes gracilis TaxID=150966 RepID=A0AAD3SI85_NEPGR|nr:hypothetical protein Nepgr_013649 [Nepenthes gracilis]
MIITVGSCLLVELYPLGVAAADDRLPWWLSPDLWQAGKKAMVMAATNDTAMAIIMIFRMEVVFVDLHGTFSGWPHKSLYPVGSEEKCTRLLVFWKKKRKLFLSMKQNRMKII